MVPQGPTPGNQALTHSAAVGDGPKFTAAPSVAGALEALLAHDVGDWGARGLDEVKQRTVRRVFRGRLGDEPVYVKVFRADTIAARARRALAAAAKGEREAKNLADVLAAGLPAVAPLAHGQAREGGQLCSFVVTRGIDAAPFSFPADDADARAAGALLRDVHDHGLVPSDLHPGNLLLPAGGPPTLCDLTSVQRTGALPMRRRAQGLAFFCNPMDGGPLGPAARALMDGYLEKGAMPPRFAAELARAARQLRATSLRSFGRRSTRSCRHTEAEPRQRAKPQTFWHVGERGADADTRKALLALDPDAHEARRRGRRGRVWLLDAFVVKDRDQGKARKLWRAHYWLLFAGIAAPTPLALRLHAGRGRVFTRRLPLPDLAEELSSGRLDDAAVAAAARSLGAMVGRLHAHGLRNRDLKLENLVRDPEGRGVAMVDLDGVTLHSAEDTRGCGRDLGRLLAAWRAAGSPGGEPTVCRFVRAYARSRRRLLQQPPMQRLLMHAEKRAREWQASHG